MRFFRAAGALLVLVTSSSLTSWAGAAHDARLFPQAHSFLADVVTRIDELGRYVVLIDADGDQRVEQAVIFHPARPLPPAPERFETGVRVTLVGDQQVRRVIVAWESADHGNESVELEVDELSGPGIARSGRGSPFEGGLALARVTGFALWPDGRELAPEVLQGRGLPTFDQARSEQVRILSESAAEACDCRECTAGGQGSSGCGIGCAGRFWIVHIGEDCSVSCGPGYYACCNCAGLFGGYGSCECKKG